MACQPGRNRRREQLRQPVRVLLVVVALGLFAGSFFWHSWSALLVAAASGLMLAFVLLIPAATDFEAGLPGLLKVKLTLLSREQRLDAVCQRECRHVTSFVTLVGVDPEQVTALVEHAVEDTCRMWRGPVADELVGRLLVCRAAQLIRHSLRLGGPYRMATPDDTSGYGPAWAAFVALDPADRLVVALAEWVELDHASVAAMLDLDVETVRQVLSDADEVTTRSVKA